MIFYCGATCLAIKYYSLGKYFKIICNTYDCFPILETREGSNHMYTHILFMVIILKYFSKMQYLTYKVTSYVLVSWYRVRSTEAVNETICRVTICILTFSLDVSRQTYEQ